MQRVWVRCAASGRWRPADTSEAFHVRGQLFLRKSSECVHPACPPRSILLRKMGIEGDHSIQQGPIRSHLRALCSEKMGGQGGVEEGGFVEGEALARVGRSPMAI